MRFNLIKGDLLSKLTCNGIDDYSTIKVNISYVEAIDLPTTSYTFTNNDDFVIFGWNYGLKKRILTHSNNKGLYLKLERTNNGDKFALVDRGSQYYYYYCNYNNDNINIATNNSITQYASNKHTYVSSQYLYAYNITECKVGYLPFKDSKVLIDPKDIISSKDIRSILSDLRNFPDRRLEIEVGKNFLREPQLNNYKSVNIWSNSYGYIGMLNNIIFAYNVDSEALQLFSQSLKKTKVFEDRLFNYFMIERSDNSYVGCLSDESGQCKNFYTLIPGSFTYDNSNLHPYYYYMENMYDSFHNMKVNVNFKDFEELKQKIGSLEKSINTLNFTIGQVVIEAVKGEKGEPGTNGVSGFPGEPGPRGDRGWKGEKGEPETNEVFGFPGEPGPRGKKGEPGLVGKQGNIGKQGLKGDSGTSGKDGSPGTKGNKGDIGPVGPQGLDGKAGTPGPKGNQGNAGPRGERGDRGWKGELGLVGKQGNIGKQGLKGDSGTSGKDGSPGTKGNKGDIGPVGPQGLDGKAGTPGPKGNQGNAGPRGERGDRGWKGELGLVGKQGNIGKQGLKGDSGTSGKDGSPGTKGNKGDVGPIGPQGLDGKTGTSGSKGNQGNVGPRGEKGEPGLVGKQGNKGNIGLPGKDANTKEAIQNLLTNNTIAHQILEQRDKSGDFLLDKQIVNSLTSDKNFYMKVANDLLYYNDQKLINSLLNVTGQDSKTLVEKLTNSPDLQTKIAQNLFGDKATIHEILEYRDEDDNLLLEQQIMGSLVDDKGFHREVANSLFYDKNQELVDSLANATDQDGKTLIEKLASDAELMRSIAEKLSQNPGKIQGPKGESGIPGKVGTDGLPGVDGQAGAKGEPGEKGDTGLSGIDGKPGAKGEQGGSGLQGLRGDKGDKGELGMQGSQGEKGNNGEIGLPGIGGQPGTKGEQGLKGATGSKGDQGSAGPRGNDGTPGMQGTKGRAGSHGLKGEPGEQGPKGERGDVGLSGVDGVNAAVAEQFFSEINQTKIKIQNVQKEVEANKNASESFTKKAQDAKNKTELLHDNVVELQDITKGIAQDAERAAGNALKSEQNAETYSQNAQKDFNNVRDIFCKIESTNQVCSAPRSKRKTKRAEDFSDISAASGASKPTSFTSNVINFFYPIVGQNKSRLENKIQELEQAAKAVDAANIATKFEKVLQKTAKNCGMQSLNFNPIKLQSTIINKQLLNDERKLLKTLLAVAKEAYPNCPDKFFSLFENHMREALADRLQQRNAIDIKKVSIDNKQPRSFVDNAIVTNSSNVYVVGGMPAGVFKLKIM